MGEFHSVKKLFVLLILLAFGISAQAERIMGEQASAMLTDAAIIALQSGDNKTIEQAANAIQKHLSLNQFRFGEDKKPKALVKLQAKLINYLAIQDKLDACDGGRRSLGKRFLNSALTSAIVNSDATVSETEELVYLSEGNWSYDQNTGSCKKVIFDEIGPIKSLTTDVVKILAFSEKVNDPLMPSKNALAKKNKFLGLTTETTDEVE